MSDRIQLENGVDYVLLENGDFLRLEQTGGTGAGTGAQPSSYPFMHRRVIERTREPQPIYKLAVDQNVARWMPAAAALLACAIPTSAAAKQPDLRYAQQPSAAILPLGPTPPTAAQIGPALAETALSARTPHRPLLDIRRYDWSQNVVPASVVIDSVVAKWAPAFSGELASFVPPARPSLDVRRYDWDPPESDWLQSTLTAPTVAQTWPAFADESARTGARAALDVRLYDWSPAFLSIPRLTDPTVATWLPAFTDKSPRTPARAKDARPYEWTSAFSPPQAEPSGGGGSNQATSTGSVGWFVRRVIERTTGPQPVYFATLQGVTPPTVAQTAPAWTSAIQGFRTANKPVLDLFRTASIPNIFGVPDDWITWAPSQDDGGRTRERARLDVRAYEWAPDEASWIAATQAPQATVAQTWPALLEASGLSYRTPARALLDVRGFDWAPAFSWVQPVLTTQLLTWGPAFSSELASFRTADRARLNVLGYEWSPDESSWIAVTLSPPVTPGQYWPALLGNLGTEYQTVARAKLDVRAYVWQPAFTWPTKVVDAIVAKWSPVFHAEEGYRTRARGGDVRVSETTPLPAWMTGSLSAPPVKVGALIIVPGWPQTILVDAWPQIVIVSPWPNKIQS
jgi:hypothetical protein